jgi:undecaprenyl-diphosphatase
VTYLQAAILGLVQGLTEFLPVSSSGHLVFVQSLFGWREADFTFDIVVHLATLLALVVYYRQDLYSIAQGALTGSRQPLAGLSPRAWCGLIVLASVPAAVVGLAFKHQIEASFSDPVGNGYQLLSTAALLFSTAPLKPRGVTLTWRSALAVGVSQAVAILPGISRSGATIATALHLGIDREQAARFSFLLSIPAIAGAFLLQAVDVARSPLPFSPDWGPLLLGFAISLVSGYLAVAVFIRLLVRGRFALFGIWCLLLGLASLWYFQ